MKKKTISVVIPVFNEEESITKLISSLRHEIDQHNKYLWEIILVENGSFDDSFKIMKEERKKDKRVKILQLAKNFGCDGGIVAGLTYAKGEAAIVMMADLQEDPKLIPQFLKKWNEGFDVVYGIVKERQGTRLTRKIGTYLFYKIINILSGNFIATDVSDFRLIDRKVYKVIVRMPEHNKFFRGVVSWTGFKQIGIPFTRKKRVAGESKASFKVVVSTAMNGIFSFTDTPLKIPLFLSILVALVGIIFFVNNDLKMFTVSLFFSCILIVLYIQNEYLKRVVEEVRNRPNFIVKATHGLTEQNS